MVPVRNLMGTPAMLVLHIVAPGEIGGLERVVQLLAQGQAEAGAQVHVALVAAGSAHPLFTSLAAAGVTPHPILLPGRAYWRERAAVLALCQRLQPDVVHTHGARPDVVDAPVARQLGIPTVTTVHGFCGGDWKNRLYERLQRRAFRRFDAVVGVAHPLLARLIRDGVPADRIHVVQNAWCETAPPFDRASARQALGVSAERFRIGWVGRLSSEKGPDVLLDALAHLTDLPLSVSFVGNGAEQPALLARARWLGVEPLVQWHGGVPDAARQFAAFDAFVLSSRTEGTPIVLFEAMAAGVPIIAASVGGVPHVVSAEEAVLVPPEDSVALAAAIRAVYQDPAVARGRAQRARARLLTDFTVPSWVDRYDAIYRLVTERVTPAEVTA
jgi:glycosyltransferase involved in cell wall biosynthesis